MEGLAMFAIPSDFPLSLVTSPVAITIVVLGWLAGLFLGIAMLAGRVPSDLDGLTRRFEEQSQWPWFRKIESMWSKRLHSWQVVSQKEDAAVLREVIITWDLLQSASKFMFGLVLVVLAPIDLLALILSKGAIMGNLPVLLVAGSLFPLGFLVGSCLAYSIGYRRVRRAMRSRVTYADLRERRLSDYRSALFLWLHGLMVGTNCLLLLLLPSLPGLSLLAPPIWIRLVICGALLLMFVVGEICLASVVRLPRLVVTSDPLVAQSADDLLRVLVIADLQHRELAAITNMIYLQWFFFLAWLLSSPFLVTTLMGVTLLWLLCRVLIGMGSEGRLGGKRTGWRWQVGKAV